MHKKVEVIGGCHIRVSKFRGVNSTQSQAVHDLSTGKEMHTKSKKIHRMFARIGVLSHPLSSATVSNVPF